MVKADLERIGFVQKVHSSIHLEQKIWSASIVVGCIVGAVVICAVRSCNTIPAPAGVERIK